MKSIKESDFSRLKPGIRAQLLSNPINHVIPLQYISKYMTQILLNDGIPCKVFSNAAAFCAVLDNGSVLGGVQIMEALHPLFQMIVLLALFIQVVLPFVLF